MGKLIALLMLAPSVTLAAPDPCLQLLGHLQMQGRPETIRAYLACQEGIPPGKILASIERKKEQEERRRMHQEYMYQLQELNRRLR